MPLDELVMVAFDELPDLGACFLPDVGIVVPRLDEQLFERQVALRDWLALDFAKVLVWQGDALRCERGTGGIAGRLLPLAELELGFL